MPLTRQIPTDAMKAVEAVRAAVQKPSQLPVRNYGIKPPVPLKDDSPFFLRFAVKRDGHVEHCCPLGLLKTAANPTPVRYYQACGRPDATTDNVNELHDDDAAYKAFGKWWDEQTDAVAAVKAVWNR